MDYKNQSNVRLIIDGEEALAEILRAIHEAEESIRIRAFMWRDDRLGRMILHALEQKIETYPDIQIDIRKDAFGTRVYNMQKIITFGKMWGDIFSTQMGKSFIDKKKNVTFSLIGSGSLLLFKYFKENDHSKVFLFDENRENSKAIIGGMNIAEEYLTAQNHADPDSGGWHDYMVIFSGTLAHDIILEKRQTEEKKWFIKKFEEGVELLMNMKDKHITRREILTELSRAKKSVIVEHGYITDSAVIRRLRQISRKGIRVKIIIPDRSDGVWHANMHSIYKLLRPNLLIKEENKNLSVYLYKGRIHAKVIVIDRKVAILGSANLTYGSFDLLSETNAIFRQTDGVVYDLVEQLEKDFAYCTKVTLESIPPYKKWLAWIQKIFI
jgi:cardiolipin synthase A/B